MSKLLRLAIALSLSISALAQNHPLPGSVVEPPVICTGCTGLNSAGEANDGKPTSPYDAPVVDHVGRYLDSTDTPTIQHAGIRTLRAGQVRVNPANGRVYLKLGSAIGAYDLGTFFTQRLAEPMVAYGGILTGSRRPSGFSIEKAARIDAFIYPEAHGSGWSTPFVDSTERLEDFDTDDRGYVYYQSNVFGWGIHLDDGRTDGQLLPFVVQVGDPMYGDATLFTMKSGPSYYAYTSDPEQTLLYDVTVPASPALVRDTSSGSSVNPNWVRAWAKNDAAGHVAVIQGATSVLRVFTYAALIAGGTPLVEHVPVTGRKFTDVSFDEAGNLWVADQGTGSMLWKLAAGSYQKTAFAIGGSTFRPETIHAAAGYVAVVGTDALPGRKFDLLLMKVVEGTPQPVNTDTWFRRYYHAAPSGFAQPSRTNANVRPFLFMQNGLTYLFYNTYGLADVYEIGQELRPPALKITSISPATGPPAGGTVVTINGIVFGADSVVSFGGTAAATTFVSSTRLTAVAPPHARGAVTVTVSSNGDVVASPAQFTYVLAPPATVTATGTSASTVSVTWSDVAGASGYRVYRNDALAGEVTGASFTDTGRSADSAYFYSIRSFDAAGNESSPSGKDVATTVQFTDSAVVRGMKVKAVHLADIRKAVNAVRIAAGWLPITGTQSNEVLAVQLSHLRSDVANLRGTHGMTPVVFTDGTLEGVLIKAVHWQELIDAVR